ncbi:MAG: undecaprenyl-phosphate glucose phosphotransferase [Cyclobacteriaceae bacterium]
MQRQHRYSRYFPILFLFADLFGLNFSFYVANYLRFNSLSLPDNYIILQIFLNVIWLLVFLGSRLQEINRSSKLLDHLNKVLTALVINLSIVFALWFAIQPVEYSRKFLFITYLTFTLSILTWRSIWHYAIRYYRALGFNLRNVLIVGSGEVANDLKLQFENTPQLGYKLAGTINNDKDESMYSLKDIENYSLKNNIDIIFCHLPSLPNERVREIINFAENNLIKVNLVSQFSRLMSYNLSIDQVGSIPMIQVNTIPLDYSINRFVKRLFDIIFSIVVFVVILSWLVPIITLLIKLESKGPIFFKQMRHGRDNKEFKIYKFRTMVVHNDPDVKQAQKGDSRITKLGSILRITSIDELPQFINVLRGDMSIVGPRPHAIQHNREYQPQIDRFWQRHAVKPGITGLAQAKGFRGETIELSDMSGRVKLDRFYVKNWSLILDFKIIILTILSILRGNENAY